MMIEEFTNSLRKEIERLLRQKKSSLCQLEEEVLRYYQEFDKRKELNDYISFIYELWRRFVQYCRDLELKLSVEEKLNKDKKQIKEFLEGYNGLDGAYSLGELILKSSDNRNPKTLKINSEEFLYHFKKFLDDNDFSNKLNLDYLKDVGSKYEERDFEKGFVILTLKSVLAFVESRLKKLESRKSKLEFAIVCYYMIGLYTTQDSENIDSWPIHVDDKYNSIKAIEYSMRKNDQL